MLYMPPVRPLPDGNGFVSIYKGAYINPATPENEMNKGYVGQCLQAPLITGESYTLSFYAGRFRSWDNYTGAIYPFNVAVFGNADCNAVPLVNLSYQAMVALLITQGGSYLAIQQCIVMANGCKRKLILLFLLR
jgi:hypothetical protein